MYRLRQDRLQWREIEGEVVIVDVDASMYLAANRAATVLWHDLAHGSTTDALARRLTETFGISGARAAEDVGIFVAALQARELLEVLPDA